MSAFIIAPETMNKIVNLADATSPRGRQLGDVSIPPLSAANEHVHREILENLAAELYALNVEALRQRYGDKEAAPPYRWQPELIQSPRDMVRHFKALRCLIYQCAEGDVPETPLFQALEAWSGEVARIIVRDLPEYDAAPWD